VKPKSYVERDGFALALADVGTPMMSAKPPTQVLHTAFLPRRVPDASGFMTTLVQPSA